MSRSSQAPREPGFPARASAAPLTAPEGPGPATQSGRGPGDCSSAAVSSPPGPGHFGLDPKDLKNAGPGLEHVGLEPGENRRGQAGAAVHLVEVPDLVVPDGDRHADLVTEVPVAEVGDVGDDPHRGAVADVVGHDALLVEGLGEGLGDTAGAAFAEESRRRRLPGLAVLAEVRLVGLPSAFPEAV